MPALQLKALEAADAARRKDEERIAAYIRAGDTFEAVAFEFIAKREAEGLAMATLVKSRPRAMLTM